MLIAGHEHHYKIDEIFTYWLKDISYFMVNVHCSKNKTLLSIVPTAVSVQTETAGCTHGNICMLKRMILFSVISGVTGITEMCHP